METSQKATELLLKSMENVTQRTAPEAHELAFLINAYRTLSKPERQAKAQIRRQDDKAQEQELAKLTAAFGAR